MERIGSVLMESFFYDCGDGWIVEIVLDNRKRVFNAYITHEDYGPVEYMFGVSADTHSLNDVEDIVYGNLERYSEWYVEDYGEDDLDVCKA